MNRKSSPRQLALFVAELPTWDSLPQDRQQALQEILSLLLEQALSQQTYASDHNLLNGTREKNHV
jgi:TRAP-type C4-dicarboxylate transport system substrate-binding protein